MKNKAEKKEERQDKTRERETLWLVFVCGSIIDWLCIDDASRPAPDSATNDVPGETIFHTRKAERKKICETNIFE